MILKERLALNMMTLPLLMVFVFMFSILQGAYFEFQPATIEQPDGEVVECFVSGDEFFNWLHDAEGYTIIVGDDGFYYYGTTRGEVVVPTEYRVNQVDPSEVALSPWAKISERLYQERRARFMAPMERNDVRAPHTGTMNNLVVYIRFSDDSEFTIPRSTYDARFNTPGSTSLRHYFQEVSYYQLDILSHHYPICDLTTNLSYQDGFPRNYYQPYHAVNNTNGYSGDTQRRLREHMLLQNAVNYIESQVPTNMVIDADNDGYVDNVSFIIRGNSGAWADLLWAHRWVLYSYDVYIHGSQVWDYTFQPENQGTVSTLSHEMFHALGAPDLYRYNYNGVPVGPWDLMASGFVHMGAWMKYKYAQGNWISEIPEISSSGTYTLNPLADPINNSFRIESPYSNNEFFVVEYRKQQGSYESSLPGSGLLVYRINLNLDGNAQGPPDEVYIYRHNGTPTSDGSINFAAYNSQNGRTEINDYNTNPTSFLGNGSAGGLHIYDVGMAGDTITFSINMVGDLYVPVMQQPENNEVVTTLTPTLSWGNINVADYYSLQIATDEQFDDIVVYESILPENNYTPQEAFAVEETYYWRVSATNDGETTDWSNPWSFSTAHFSPLATNLAGAAYGNAIWGDLSNNGYLDLVSTGNHQSKIYLNPGTGHFVNPNVQLPPLRFSDVALGDLTDNGYLDIILIGRDDNNIPQAYVFANEGSNNFTELDLDLTGAFNGSIAIGDYNNDGLLDFVITGDSADGRSINLYRNEGNNVFTAIENTGLAAVSMGDLAWADFNLNGMLDLLVTGISVDGALTEIYHNSGDDTFVAGDHGLLPCQGSSVDVADYTNNGYPDIVVSGNSSQGLVTKIYNNNGDGVFVELDSDLPGVALGSCQWGDFNQNGSLDLLLSGFNNASVFRNVDGNFVNVQDGLTPVNFSSAAWGDFDNDGDLDILLTGSGAYGTVTEIYRNNIGTNEFTPNTPPATPQNPSTVVGQCTVSFSWDLSFDNETPQEAITYNLSVGSNPGTENIISSLSDLDSGYRKIPEGGNVGYNTELILTGLDEGTYYWRVQSVDGVFAGSTFTEEQSFYVEGVSVDNEFVAPLATRLNNNYPNPFNPETKISFVLSNETDVTLVIYNITGQKVMTLVDDKLRQGDHSFVWKGQDNYNRPVSSGIYFYRLNAGQYSETKKMLLLK